MVSNLIEQFLTIPQAIELGFLPHGFISRLEAGEIKINTKQAG